MRRTRLSYSFKMVSRTNIELNIVLIAIVLVFSIDSVCPSNVNNNLSTTPIPPKIQYTTETVNRNISASKSVENDMPLFSTDNELWDGLIKDCLHKPSFSCFQKNVHNYLNSALELDDVNVTSSFKFLKNKVDLYKYTKEANDHLMKENEIPDEEARSASPIEEVTDALSGKGVQFLMTHDIELNMPSILFDSSILRISPRSFEGNGALVKVELMPNEARGVKATGRILFKKIKKFFRNKLLLSFLAIVLVIKLIKIKVLWILPLIVGVTTAKKLVLKFVLFLFPALANIFKLCSYYHKNYHDTKFHHHQHHISHLHTVVPPWYNEPHHDHSVTGYSGPELIYTNPPKGHPSEYLHGHSNYGHDWEPSGLGSEYISDVHRNAHVHSFKPKVDDVNEINSWGLGTTMPSSASHSNNYNPLLKDTVMRNVKIDQIGQHNSPVYTPVKVAPKIQYNMIQNDKMAHEAQRLQAQQKEAMRILTEQKLVTQQQKILQQQPFVQDTSGTSTYLDPFYSPILAKIDKIFLQLNVIDESCRERLVCNMYKNPAKYSPHSNFISAELSRDTAELRRPDSTNPAVIRFYRYVQAARDGQDQKDCQEFYKLCQIRLD
ncbi:hypothetical protein Bhyg_10254 [Pseudolycoriella hygida]|uniref:Uncharacterized protein n=1 Tax=Pseudolycoriella hygida TaxID=35572 RepID=A0A9Q0MT63_9DIPT|nr:hypothetical protein Bhyg_10254 [Pseudolycoriella hygida]